MQTALLLFMVLISLAIGFFIGLLLNSSESPLGSSQEDDAQPDQEKSPPEPDKEAPASSSQPTRSKQPSTKPTPQSRLILQIWQEPGSPPQYEYQGRLVTKDQLPEELLHLITIRKTTPQVPEPTSQPRDSERTEDPENDESAGKMLSVIEEIEKILQRKLADSPLAEKGIHLMENHNREIRIWVGLESYDSIEDIPDLQVQQLINAAVKEWEQKSA